MCSDFINSLLGGLCLDAEGDSGGAEGGGEVPGRRGGREGRLHRQVSLQDEERSRRDHHVFRLYLKLLKLGEIVNIRKKGFETIARFIPRNCAAKYQHLLDNFNFKLLQLSTCLFSKNTA